MYYYFPIFGKSSRLGIIDIPLLLAYEKKIVCSDFRGVTKSTKETTTFKTIKEIPIFKIIKEIHNITNTKEGILIIILQIFKTNHLHRLNHLLLWSYDEEVYNPNSNSH